MSPYSHFCIVCARTMVATFSPSISDGASATKQSLTIKPFKSAWGRSNDAGRQQPVQISSSFLATVTAGAEIFLSLAGDKFGPALLRQDNGKPLEPHPFLIRNEILQRSFDIGPQDRHVFEFIRTSERVANFTISNSAKLISQRSVTIPTTGQWILSNSSTGPPLNPPISVPAGGSDSHKPLTLACASGSANSPSSGPQLSYRSPSG